jgi:hypothetical protein
MKFSATILFILAGTTVWAGTAELQPLSVILIVDLARVADTSHEQITRRGTAQGFEALRQVKTAQAN